MEAVEEVVLAEVLVRVARLLDQVVLQQVVVVQEEVVPLAQEVEQQ